MKFYTLMKFCDDGNICGVEGPFKTSQEAFEAMTEELKSVRTNSTDENYGDYIFENKDGAWAVDNGVETIWQIAELDEKDLNKEENHSSTHDWENVSFDE